MTAADRDMENGMVRYIEKPMPTYPCPKCGAEWEEVSDGTEVRYAHAGWVSRRFPIRGRFCPACAAGRATAKDLMALVRERNLIGDFLKWLLTGDAPDAPVIWNALLCYDRALVDSRLEEFVSGSMLAAWLCED